MTVCLTRLGYFSYDKIASRSWTGDELETQRTRSFDHLLIEINQPIESNMIDLEKVRIGQRVWIAENFGWHFFLDNNFCLLLYSLFLLYNNKIKAQILVNIYLYDFVWQQEQKLRALVISSLCLCFVVYVYINNWYISCCQFIVHVNEIKLREKIFF